MGLFDSLTGAIKGALGDIDTSALPGMLGQIVGKTDLGNVGNLLEKLKQGGLGTEVSSWLGSGANLPLNVDQLRTALGNAELQQMAQSLGIPVDQVLESLSKYLPTAVDKMSPNGVLEEPAADGN